MLACERVPNHQQVTYLWVLEGAEKAKYIRGSTSGGEGGGAFLPSCSAVLPCGPDWFWVVEIISREKLALIVLVLLGRWIAVLWHLKLILGNLVGVSATACLALLQMFKAGCEYLGFFSSTLSTCTYLRRNFMGFQTSVILIPYRLETPNITLIDANQGLPI